MRTVRRLRLRCFAFYDYSCRAVHSVTLCPVETSQAHHKDTISLTQYKTQIHFCPWSYTLL